MRLNKRINIIVAAGLIVCFSVISSGILNCKGDRSSREKESSFYKGLQERPIKTESYITQVQTIHKFKPALQGDTLEHDFILKNNGKEPLNIKKVKAG